MGTAKSRKLWFGDSWDAPVNAPKDRLSGAPTWLSCIKCEKRFEEGDQGVLFRGEIDWSGYHKECLLDEILIGRVDEGELSGR